MSARPRLAYLSLETPRPGQASQTHIDEIIAGLTTLGWDVELFATRSGGASAGTSFFARLIGYARVQRALSDRLGEFDAVYVRSHAMTLPLALSARRRGIPVVHEINGKPADIGVSYPSLKWLAPLFSRLYRIQYRWADHLVAVTPGLAQWARQFAGHDRVSTVSNGANTRLFTPDGLRGGVDGRYVIFVGGLVAWHGIDTMLAALDQQSWPHDVRLVIVGDGIERPKVEAAAKHAKLLWLGRQPYDQIPALLRGSIAALCVIQDQDCRSASGVAPLKLFEAMACGVPVIVSDLPFQAELVREHRTGIVVPTANCASLASAVARLTDDCVDAGRLGMNGRRYVERFASWQARATDISEELCRQIKQAPPVALDLLARSDTTKHDGPAQPHARHNES